MFRGRMFEKVRLWVPFLLDLNCIILIIIENFLPWLGGSRFFLMVVPELAKFPLKTLQRGAMAVCLDEVSIEVHICITELVIIRW